MMWEKKIKGLAIAGALSLASVAAAPADADAFCGFYVSGGDAELFNDATQVALMRSGEKTILSMQNNYQGPTKKFAMVVPVPVVLMEDDVKTLPADLFKKIDQLSAPRLVEYWERDPCEPEYYYDDFDAAPTAGAGQNNAAEENMQEPPKVVVEAQFDVAEYEIVILSATEANALESWLTTNNYNIPNGATSIFSQYIQQGMYFFVAKVDPAKVTFKDGQAVLSPLRFAYDSPEFSLPVRLGMVNSAGAQDLLVYILSQEGRYEVSNYSNATIPTNIEVSKDVRDSFGTFYTKLFDRTLEQNPKSVVTEYAWDASTCDPCPGPTLAPDDYATLGADELGDTDDFGRFGRGWTLTRLHARYSKDEISEDLIFRKAPAIVGGREFYNNGQLETGSNPAEYGSDNFQGRYIMRNRWAGAVKCDDPRYGRWGGPPAGTEGSSSPQSALSPNSAGVSANASPPADISDRDLETLIEEDIDEIGVRAQDGEPSRGGCSTTGSGAIPGALLGVFAALGLVRVRRRRSSKQ